MLPPEEPKNWKERTIRKLETALPATLIRRLSLGFFDELLTQ
jgi:hypothetical protein